MQAARAAPVTDADTAVDGADAEAVFVGAVVAELCPRPGAPPDSTKLVQCAAAIALRARGKDLKPTNAFSVLRTAICDAFCDDTGA